MITCPIFSTNWPRCTKEYRAATFDFWMASVLCNIQALCAPELMLDHASEGLLAWCKTWRIAS